MILKTDKNKIINNRYEIYYVCTMPTMKNTIPKIAGMYKETLKKPQNEKYNATVSPKYSLISSNGF